MSESLSSHAFHKRMREVVRNANLRKARFPNDTAAKRIRRKAEALVSPEVFNALYLQHYFKKPAAAFHSELYRALEQSTRTVVRAPRGHAKSTVVNFAYGCRQVACARVLKAWVNGTLEQEDPELYAAVVQVIAEVNAEREVEHEVELELAGSDAEREQLRQRGPQLVKLWFDPYIQIVAVDKGLATDFTEAIKVELETNERILGDWGVLIGDPGFNYDDYVTLSDVRVTAFGMLSGLRGPKHGPYRPSLALIDDPDSPATVTSEKVWLKQRKKIQRDLEFGLEPKTGRIFMVGTPLHPESLVVHFSQAEKFKARWKVLRYKAITDEGVPLWPERWTLEELHEIELEDEEGFLGEMMDTPPSDGDKPFEELHYYSRADFQDVRLTKVLIFDPAVGKNKNSDGQAVVVLRGPTKAGEVLVHRTESLRIAGLLELEARVNAIAEEEDCDVELAESIGFQEFLVQILELRGDETGALRRWQRIESHKESKDLRIRGLASMSNRAKLLWPDDGSCKPGEREALAYPHGKRDILDSIEMGTRVMRQRKRRRSFKDIASRFVPRPHAKAMASGDWI